LIWIATVYVSMIRGEFENAGERSPSSLRSAYAAVLAETVERFGVGTTAEETGLNREALASLVDGDPPELTLEEAAAILALDDERPPADAVEAEARDILLMGMSTAVLDVEALAAGIDGAMDPKEIQQKIEGRHPLTLGEYALLHAFVESRQ
jgi:hypothetical protein